MIKSENYIEDKLLKRISALEKTIKEICGPESKITSSVDSVDDKTNITTDKNVKHYVNIEVNEKIAKIDVETLQIQCTDQLLHHLLSSVSQKISQCLLPI